MKITNNSVEYVIFAPNYDYTKLSYGDILENPKCHYITGFTDSSSIAVKFLIRVSLSRAKRFLYINKGVLNRCRLTKEYTRSGKLVFIIYADVADVFLGDGSNFICYLRGEYPNAKFVWFSVNLYSSERQPPMELAEKNFDFLVTTEVGDTRKYPMKHYPDFMSKFDTSQEDYETEESDFYFLGAAKDRLHHIVETYDKLEKQGFDCKFLITGVDEANRVERKGIEYINRITYPKNISYVKKTRCIVEICNPGQEGSTLRAIEAVLYNKKILSNNKTLLNEPYYREGNVLFIDNIRHVSDFMSTPYNPVDDAENMVGPAAFFKYLEEQLY